VQEPETNNRQRTIAYLSKYGICFTFALLTGILAVISRPFRSLSNIENILQQISVNGIIAIGMTLVIVTAGIDLSVRSIPALSAVAKVPRY
jgi:putative xylitol transport system permease protein